MTIGALGLMLFPMVAWGQADALRGKRIGVIGDSYVRNHRDKIENTWHYQFAAKHGMQYFNYGKNGNCIALDREGHSNGLYKRYRSMADSLDYVIVIAGHNDAAQGMVDSIGMDTFRQRLGMLCEGLIGRYPKASVFFFTPWTCQGFVGSMRQKVVDAMIDVCGSYGIPVFDSARRSNIFAADRAFREIYFQGKGGTDDAHLNREGHKRFLPVAESFILQYVER